MSATATMARSVSRVYTRADGARAVLLYADRHGGHRVTYLNPMAEGETWLCADVEGARARWRVLARKLKDLGFRMGGRPVTAPKPVYVVRVTGGELKGLDVPATVLWLISRGKHPISGDIGREQRLQLAEILDGMAIAAALRDGRPLVVEGEGGMWTFREV